MSENAQDNGLLSSELTKDAKPLGWIKKHDWIIIAVTVVVTLIILKLMGRPLWCKCGGFSLWISDVNSSHCSQHFWDAYTFSHLLHGFGFYGIFFLVFRKWGKGTVWASHGRILAVSLILESLWEIAENTPWIINKYRADTISLDYFGDSVINSFSDILAAFLGFYLARKLPVWSSVTICVLSEVIMLWAIRDNLLINIIMLLCPIEAIKNWQLGI